MEFIFGPEVTLQEAFTEIGSHAPTAEFERILRSPDGTVIIRVGFGGDNDEIERSFESGGNWVDKSGGEWQE